MPLPPILLIGDVKKVLMGTDFRDRGGGPVQSRREGGSIYEQLERNRSPSAR